MRRWAMTIAPASASSIPIPRTRSTSESSADEFCRPTRSPCLLPRPESAEFSARTSWLSTRPAAPSLPQRSADGVVLLPDLRYSMAPMKSTTCRWAAATRCIPSRSTASSPPRRLLQRSPPCVAIPPAIPVGRHYRDASSPRWIPVLRRAPADGELRTELLETGRIEGFGKKVAHLHHLHFPFKVGQNHRNIAAKFPNELPARAARRGQRFGIRDHRDGLEAAFALAHGFENGQTLGANRQTIRCA